MAEVKWIKIRTDMFEDEKIDFISSLPEADSIIVIWVRLLTLAGKCNAGGYIYLTEKIPYTEEMLAHKFKKPINTIKLAFETFRRLDMVELDTIGMFLPNWDKHQNVEGLEKIREQGRERQARHRSKQKLLPAGNDESNVTHNVTITQGNAIELDIELELDKEINTSRSGLTPEPVTTKKRTAKAVQVFDESSPEFQLAKKLRTAILSNLPNATCIPKSDSLQDMQKWAKVFDLIFRINKVSKEELETLINFATTDQFWHKNILSPGTLREKIDRLRLEIKDKNRPRVKRPQQAPIITQGASDKFKDFSL